MANVAVRSISVPLYPPSYRHWRNIGHASLPALLAAMPDQEVRFSDIVDQLKRSNKKSARATVEEGLREGEWLGLIEITDLDESAEYWRVRKVGR